MMRRRQRLAVAAAEVVVNLTVCFVEADQGDGRPGGGKAAALRLAMALPSPPIPTADSRHWDAQRPQPATRSPAFGNPDDIPEADGRLR
jgi:hypothetical protein